MNNAITKNEACFKENVLPFFSIRHFPIFLLFTSQQRKTLFPFPLYCDPNPVFFIGVHLWSSPFPPLPQDDAPNPIFPIAYKEEFCETMDYFRAIYKANGSPHALHLNRQAICLNPSN
ncbi:hypothetical protein ERO13_A10G135766v2 [Gossypium hirsutum]|nr:hypothetical protein ERO13_A10G135766v2 [Gossypium hirsutum]